VWLTLSQNETMFIWGLGLNTLNALANSSPGLPQPWVNNANEILRNSDRVATALRVGREQTLGWNSPTLSA
jgi:hypothetical protein